LKQTLIKVILARAVPKVNTEVLKIYKMPASSAMEVTNPAIFPVNIQAHSVLRRITNSDVLKNLKNKSKLNFQKSKINIIIISIIQQV